MRRSRQAQRALAQLRRPMATILVPGALALVMFTVAVGSPPSAAPTVAPTHSSTTARIESGDIILVRRDNLLSRAVLAAESGSQWSHMGLAEKDATGQLWVIHAAPSTTRSLAGHVRRERLERFVDGRDTADVAIYRLRIEFGPDIADRATELAIEWARDRLAFDGRFELREQGPVYCTELVWRAFREAGVDLLPPRDALTRVPLLKEKVLLPEAFTRHPALIQVPYSKGESQ